MSQKKGYDDSNSVMWVQPGTKFVIVGENNHKWLHDREFCRPIYIRLREQDSKAHLCHPESKVAAVMIRDAEGNECFDLAMLRVRSDVQNWNEHLPQAAPEEDEMCNTGDYDEFLPREQ